ncbi:hypothetical protein BW723_14380 [Polaribacter reichenbachii]|uniref:Uncharacterized protein n=1 Tax=Polaribacter reichenbachii TaxID=996801 RepID=A0A1B8TZI3_9FLAO|nr:hypothetical protein [Polaribacter reichenbachii]APZ47397.1 hypothetical protein BW723_14380 [Polaribacter reichenbachii]AUC18037.1 hypothetical protein BTO17_04830 [Polaribacter reichenbachii]OBY65037.1 hypothetical protein LPB301_09470 [Polaribacter reichenbachii]
MSENTIRILLILVSTAISLLSRKYIEPILPERKKAISYIKKFLFFVFTYVLNIGLMIYFFITLEFNKYFILVMLFYFGLIFKFIITDSINGHWEKITNIHWKQITSIAEEIDKINGIKKN